MHHELYYVVVAFGGVEGARTYEIGAQCSDTGTSGVGFPEDMHVSDHSFDTSVFDPRSTFQKRECQSMFTFSVGFEAATPKNPNKDSTAYGPAASMPGATNALCQAGFLHTSAPFSDNALFR